MNDAKELPAPGRSWVLGAVAFVSGACVMVVEVVGTRVLTPVFGVGLFVWSALLLVTLGALSCGYYVGGWVADRRRWPPLPVQLMLAGGFIALAPLLRVPVLGLADALGLRLGPVIAALMLFAPALCVLGMVSTTVAKLAVRSTASAGQSVGRVYAISTVGSLVGTLAAGFWLVPSFSASAILSGVAALLLLVGGLGLTGRNRGFAALAIAPLLLGASSEPGGGEGFEVLARRQSLHGNLAVVRDSSRSVPLLLLRADHSLIGAQWETGEPAFSFVHLLSAGLYAREGVKRALVIGLGVGSAVKPLQEAGLTVDVVELDGGVVDLAREHFGLAINGGVFVEDARTFIQRVERKYDIIVHDTFTGGETPEHLLSVEVIRRLSTLLTHNGILTLNLVGASEGSLSRAPLAVRATLLEVFPHVRSFRDGPSGTGEELHNLVQFASRAEIVFAVPPDVSPEDQARSKALREFQSWEVFEGEPGGELITDAHNPVAQLSTRVSERFHEQMRERYPLEFWID